MVIPRPNKHIRYLRYVLRHKFFVYQEGRKLGLSRRQLFVHDWQKFVPVEWFPYVEKFFGGKPSPRRADGGYDPLAQGEAFTRAWRHHVQHGPHHWQYWCTVQDGGGIQTSRMPTKYWLEMIADWRGASRANQGDGDVTSWYKVNRDKMVLHEETRKDVEGEIRWV